MGRSDGVFKPGRAATAAWGVMALGAVGLMIGLGPGRARAGGTGLPETGPDWGGVIRPASGGDGACVSCHAIDAAFSHPVGFMPGRSLPEAMPLQNGRMTCLTCHEDDAGAHTRVRGRGDPMLRLGLEGRALCLSCHESSPFSKTGGHSMAVSKAHLIWAHDKPDRAVRGARGGLDAESSSCLECHDGTIASAVGTKRAGAEIASFGANQTHPVGVPFRDRSGKDRSLDMRLVSPHTLDPRIRLFDGSVGCGSCHSMYSPHENKLVMSNQRSALCLSCHADR